MVTSSHFICLLVEHMIDTSNARPIKDPLERSSLWQQTEIATQMTKLLRMGVISPCESEWAANVILVQKKGNAYRMVVDSRPLNRVTIKDIYPIGCIQNMLDCLCGNEWFTTFDLFFGNHHIPKALADRHKTEFIVPAAPGFPGGLFQFNKMCFDLANAPATFCV